MNPMQDLLQQTLAEFLKNAPDDSAALRAQEAEYLRIMAERAAGRLQFFYSRYARDSWGKEPQ